MELSAGTVEYKDTSGAGPVSVLLHGLAMNFSLWHQALPDLRTDYHCGLRQKDNRRSNTISTWNRSTARMPSA